MVVIVITSNYIGLQKEFGSSPCRQDNFNHHNKHGINLIILLEIRFASGFNN